MNKLLLLGMHMILTPNTIFTILVQGHATPYHKKYKSGITQVWDAEGGGGTGFFINEQGKTILLTAAHVCNRQKMLFSDWGIHKVIYKDIDKDTCVLTTYQNVPTLTLGEDPVKGDKVYTIGFPLDLRYDYEKGTVNNIELIHVDFPTTFYNKDGTCPTFAIEKDNLCIQFHTSLRAAMLIRPGNSGGPLFNKKGQVVGIVIATDGGRTGSIIPISDVEEVLSNVNVFN